MCNVFLWSGISLRFVVFRGKKKRVMLAEFSAFFTGPDFYQTLCIAPSYRQYSFAKNPNLSDGKMNKQNDLQKGFYLENWLVEPHLGRVTAGHRSIRLEPKIMDVLVCLAEHQGEVVKKEQFFETTWGDVNVTPHVLARAISEIRRNLCDEAQNPRFIQTVPKIGYRLIAPVSYTKTFADGAAPGRVSPYFFQFSFAYLLIAAGLVGALILTFGILVVFLMTRHGGAH